jgi:hypothetical protein
MSIDTRQYTRKSSQPIDSNAENELMCVYDSQTQVTPPQGVEGKRSDTVGEFKSAEIGASHMLSWKAKTRGKLTQEKVLLEP